MQDREDLDGSRLYTTMFVNRAEQHLTLCQIASCVPFSRRLCQSLELVEDFILDAVRNRQPCLTKKMPSNLKDVVLGLA
jgi:hypothetical protein